jgi:hypothetical protein
MVKRSGKQGTPARIKQHPGARAAKASEELSQQDAAFQRLDQLYIDLLRIELDTALTLAHMSRGPMKPDFCQRANARSYAIRNVVLEQLSKMQLGELDQQWIDQKIKEIERSLEK